MSKWDKVFKSECLTYLNDGISLYILDNLNTFLFDVSLLLHLKNV